MKAKYQQAVEITPGAGDVTVSGPDAFYIGGTGDVKVDFVGGGTVTFENMIVGNIYPFEITKVYQTGTTATNIIGLDSKTTY